MKDSAFRILSVGVFALLVTASSFADPIPLLAGRPLQPLKKTTVGIVEEDLSIELTTNKLNVKAILHLKNYEESSAFPVGFPCDPDLPDMTGMSCRSPLHVAVRGKAIGTKLEAVAGYGRCWVWDMRLEKGEDVVLEIDYSSEIVNDRYSDSVPLAGVWFVYYPLRTGANWAGSIGRLTISVSIPVETIVQISPAGYTRTYGLIEWTLSDYEPMDDIFVVLDPYQTSRYISEILPKKGGAEADRRQRDAFGESFLAAMPEIYGSYESMASIFKRLVFPPPQGIERVVWESYEVMRLRPQKHEIRRQASMKFNDIFGKPFPIAAPALVCIGK